MTPRFQVDILLFDRRHPSLAADPPPDALLPSASAMVADLLSAAEIPHEFSGAEEIVAKTIDAQQTLYLIQQVQLLLEGFSKQLAGRLVYAGISVVSNEPGGAAGDMRGHLRGKSVAGLVLLSAEAYSELRSFPGLQFKQLTKQQGMNGCWELAPPAWLTRTMRPPPPTVAAPAVQQSPAQPVRVVAPDNLPRLATPGAQFEVWSARLRLLWASVPSWGRASAIGLVAVILGAAGLVHYKGATSPPAVSKPSQEPTHVGAGPQVPAVVLAQPPSTSNTSHAGTTRPAPEPQTTPKRRTPEPAPPVEKVAPEHPVAGLPEGELRSLINKAERASGNGQYDEAIRYYEFILRRDPRNAEATRGLARARQNKASSGSAPR